MTARKVFTKDEIYEMVENLVDHHKTMCGTDDVMHAFTTIAAALLSFRELPKDEGIVDDLYISIYFNLMRPPGAFDPITDDDERKAIFTMLHAAVDHHRENAPVNG